MGGRANETQTARPIVEDVEYVRIHCGPCDSKVSVIVGLWGSLHVFVTRRTVEHCEYIFRHRYLLVKLC